MQSSFAWLEAWERVVPAVANGRPAGAQPPFQGRRQEIATGLPLGRLGDRGALGGFAHDGVDGSIQPVCAHER